MTDAQVTEYINLASRLSELLTMSGISWKPEHEKEKAILRKKIAEYRKIIEEEKEKRTC